MNKGHWIYNGPDFEISEYEGFCYLITNILSGRKYIGKKSFWSRTTKKIVGKRNKRVTKESNWKTYTSSSKIINEEIGSGETFTYEIISLHTSKGALAYAEVDNLVRRDALRSRSANGTRSYYNGCIPGIKFIPPDEKIK